MKQARLLPISRNFDAQGPPLVQPNQTERGECDPNSKAVAFPTAHEDKAFYRSLDPPQEVLLMRMLKQPVRDDERISDLPDCSTPDSVKSDNQNRIGLIIRDETRNFTLNSSYRVPAKLPRFKGAPGGVTDPEKFLEIFGSTWNTHSLFSCYLGKC